MIFLFSFLWAVGPYFLVGNSFRKSWIRSTLCRRENRVVGKGNQILALSFLRQRSWTETLRPCRHESVSSRVSSTTPRSLADRALADKSTTKFVPKKRSKPSSAPAPSGVSSVGGSVAGTPRVAALGLDGLAPLSEIAGEDGFTSPAPPAKAQASGASMRGRENAAGASQSQAGLSHGPSSGFAGSTQAASFSSSDPTFSQIQQTQSTAPSSFAATPKSGAGTAFTFSQTGPAQAAAAPSSQQADEEEEPLPVQPKKKQLSGRNMEEVLASRLANDVEANANANANVNALGLGMDLDPASSPPPLPAAGPGLVNRVASPKKLTAAEKGKGKAVVAPPVEDEAPLPPKIAPIAPGKPAAPKKPKAVRKSRARIRTPPPPVYDADGVLIPPPPVIPKRTRGPNKPKIPRARVMRMIDGVEVEGFASDEEPVPKRRRAVKKAKATKLDLEIFDNPKLDGHGAAADEEESGEPELDENGVAIPKKAKGKKKAEEVELPTVDSGTWTMSSISTPRDVIGGRISARFLDCQKKDIATKQARNLRRKKMRDRATRRAKGEPSASEAEDEPVLPLDHAEVKKNESRANSEKVVAGAKTAEQEDAEELAKMNRLYPDEAEENERVIKENRKNKEAPNPLPDLAPLADVDDPMVDHVREGTARAGEGEQEYDSDGDLVETQYAPQMRIVDGEMVLDDASLEVDRSKDVSLAFRRFSHYRLLTLPRFAQAKLGHVGEREIIEESARDRYVNSGTWGKQRKTEKWTNTETLYFYDVRFFSLSLGAILM